MLQMIMRIGILSLILVSAEARAGTGARLVEDLYLSGRVGLVLATHAGPGANDQSVAASYQSGFTAGGSAEFYITNILAVQAEVLFAQKGADTTKDGSRFGTYRMDYIECPLLARIERRIHRRVGVYGILGPTLSVLLDANIDLADGRHFDLENSFRRIDFGILLGAGTAIDMGAGAITIDARYNHGFPNIDTTAAPENDDVMNRAFYFTVGYRANLDDLLHGFRRNAPPPARKAPPGLPPGPSRATSTTPGT